MNDNFLLAITISCIKNISSNRVKPNQKGSCWWKQRFEAIRWCDMTCWQHSSPFTKSRMGSQLWYRYDCHSFNKVKTIYHSKSKNVTNSSFCHWAIWYHNGQIVFLCTWNRSILHNFILFLSPALETPTKYHNSDLQFLAFLRNIGNLKGKMRIMLLVLLFSLGHL